jgi:hypothetical protein
LPEAKEKTMAEEKQQVVPDPTPVRIVPDVPFFFSDGVASHSFAPGISKFYFYRSDVSPLGAMTNSNVVVAQAIMSAEAFARSLHFLNHRLKMMVKAGAISQDTVDEAFSIKHDEV